MAVSRAMVFTGPEDTPHCFVNVMLNGITTLATNSAGPSVGAGFPFDGGIIRKRNRTAVPVGAWVACGVISHFVQGLPSTAASVHVTTTDGESMTPS